MANWNNPLITSTYTNVISEFKDRDLDLAKGMDVSITNPVADMIKWNSSSNKWEKYNGSQWNPLSSNFDINVATANAWANGRTITLTGDVIGVSAAWTGSGNISFSTILPDINIDIGSFGSISSVPIITVNAKGQITGVSTASLGNLAQQDNNNVTITGGNISLTEITLKQSAGAAPLVSGVLQFDTTNKLLKVGDGAATKTIVDISTTQSITSKTFSTNCVWNGNAISINYGGTGHTLGSDPVGTAAALALALG